MAIRFRQVGCDPLREFDAAAPDGAWVGLVGEDGAGKSRVLELAAGRARPQAGGVEAPESRRWLGPEDHLDFSPVELLLMDDTLARHDLLVRGQAAAALDRLRRAGATILMVSHDLEVLAAFADEIWWLERGRLAGRGDPREMLDRWRGHVARRMREWGETAPAALDPRVRRGDGRARIESVETIGEDGRQTMVWHSGELAVVRVAVRFRDAAPDPVIGIMIRTRVGLNVYGTNTELEGLRLGARGPGDCLTVSFAFRCELCPGEYTLTAASHDPDGVWHDWLEDAAAFTVTDSRYTAGVANLRATVRVENRHEHT